MFTALNSNLSYKKAVLTDFFRHVNGFYALDRTESAALVRCIQLGFYWVINQRIHLFHVVVDALVI